MEAAGALCCAQSRLVLAHVGFEILSSCFTLSNTGGLKPALEFLKFRSRLAPDSSDATFHLRLHRF